MSELPYLPFYDGDFRRKTAHLTFDERSGYFWLLVAMWGRDGSVPDDDRDNARALGLTLKRWRKIKPRILPFLTTLPNGDLTQERLRSEFQKGKSKLISLRANGALGGMARARNTKDLAEANAKDLLKPGSSIARASTKSSQEERTPNGVPKKGSRLSENWKLPLDDEAWALERGFTRAEIQGEAIRFHNYWTARAGAGATKLNWSRTWQNWMLDKLDRRRKADPRPETDQEKMLRSLKRYQ